jgi:hypothetical protein
VLVHPGSIMLGGLPELFQTQWCVGETPTGSLPLNLTLGVAYGFTGCVCCCSGLFFLVLQKVPTWLQKASTPQSKWLYFFKYCLKEVAFIC